MVPYYRHIPRTIQKLWKGEPIHIIVMGSSIDRGSANPPMYLYDENPSSKTFKQPLSDRVFEASKVNRSDLDGYYGWWQHYFSYGGRLKLELMRKFNLGPDKICLNFMACDGSCVGEAHSGLKDYCSLSRPPSPGVNGHKAGTTWKKLYPGLFSRPGGPRPDLIIFGSGANEKTDTPDEAAVFEGTIRWIQQHYPNTEFLFCQFQNKGGYTPNPGDMQALSLRYQIPFMDYGKIGDDITRWCNPYTLVPRDGHPQAASHYIWFKQLEKAFECWDPTVSGIAQLQLPERMHKNTYGWEGTMRTYGPDSKRIHRNIFIMDDTAVNCWGEMEKDSKDMLIDGKTHKSRRSYPKRYVRNSMFRYGNCKLGDRHVLEVPGSKSKLTYVDSKVCNNRRYIGIDQANWQLSGKKPVPFESEFGAPFGSQMVELKPGESINIDVIATDLSIAYVDKENGGTLTVSVDGKERLQQPTNIPYTDSEKKKHFMENRKGILDLGYGLHHVTLKAEKAPVLILGVFAYDSRPNRQFERRLNGIVSAGETIKFTLPFQARPVVICNGKLQVKPNDITKTSVTFSGTGSGFYEIVGE
jgi:hypothetical protein